MAMRKPRHVALILSTNFSYHRKMIRGVAAYARKAGNWSLYIEEPPDRFPNLRSWRGQGVITAFAERRYVEAIGRLHIPVVGVEGGYGWYDPDSNIPYFATDDEAVARLAADHLIGQGFARLAYCGVPRNRFNVWSERRARAFQRRAHEAGLPCSLYTGRHRSSRNWSELQRGLAQWLRSLKKPLGLMAANDARARLVLEACRAIGVRVPEDVAVIGVDNDELICELTEPPLTSIEQGAWSIGYQAAALLDRLMSGKRAAQIENYVAPATVACRRSTAYLVIDDADVAAAVQYIRQHACRHMRVADITDALGMSRSTLAARFRKILGKTVHEEIQATMIARARQLIAAGDLPLKQVAAEAGFSHVQHMANRFRRCLGQTPGEFRRVTRLSAS
jgi:LacI family transcriptional regulator